MITKHSLISAQGLMLFFYIYLFHPVYTFLLTKKHLTRKDIHLHSFSFKTKFS